MRKRAGILYLKRFLTHLLLAAIPLIAFHLPMRGETVDSLYLVFINAETGQRPDLVNAVSQHLYQKQITDTLYQCDKSTKDNMVEAIMHYLMAEHYYDLGQYENALLEGEKARDVMDKKKSTKFQSDVMGMLSNAQYRIGDYDEALKTLLTAYEIDKKLKKPELISSDLHTLAAIYLAVEQPVQGIQYAEKAIAIERKLNRTDRLATRLGLASELYLLNNELNKAIEAINEAYKIDKQDPRTEKAAIRMVQMGTVFEAMGKLNEAQQIIEQAIPTLKEKGITYSLAIAYNQLGSIKLRTNNQQEAIDYYKMALEQSIKCGSPKVERIAERGLWEAMRESNPKGALLHLERYSELNDSMVSKMAATRIKVIETTNQITEQNELDNKNKLFKQVLKWGGFALVAMLVALLAGVLYSRRKVNNALKMQQQTQDLRNRFFTNITNELQTPLSVVMGAGQQLLSSSKSNAEEKRLGEMIINHGKNMLGLVNQLLDIEKIQTTIEKPDLKRGDIMMFARMLVDNYTDAAQQKLINLEFLSPVHTLMVAFAPDHLRRILHILIDNAIKFTPRNGKVTVKMTPIESSRMKLEVSDTGKGIPTEEINRLFEPMVQSANGDDGVGTGLGLSLVNQLVNAMNGTINVDSKLGQGTLFTIEFPVRYGEDATQSTTSESHMMAENLIRQPKNGKHNPLVFIVENNDDVAFFIASLLNKKYNLRFARDGQEAWQTAQDMVPDLIISNIIMPVMDGKQLIEKVRSSASLNHIPIIALTNSNSEKERLACLQAGADIVLVKPFNSEELSLQAEHLIEQRMMLRERYQKASGAVPADSGAKPMSKEDQDFINKLVDIIHVHMTKENADLDIDSIAAALSLSRKQLRNRIASITGMTTVAFVLQVRLNYARRIISTEDTPMTAVANRCGFQTLSHFSKAFKQQFGVSPQQFRKNMDGLDLINNPRMSSQ